MAVGVSAAAPPPGRLPTPQYNDQRRLEPVRIIKSLAFQLAQR